MIEFLTELCDALLQYNPRTVAGSDFNHSLVEELADEIESWAKEAAYARAWCSYMDMDSNWVKS